MERSIDMYNINSVSTATAEEKVTPLTKYTSQTCKSTDFRLTTCLLQSGNVGLEKI